MLLLFFFLEILDRTQTVIYASFIFSTIGEIKKEIYDMLTQPIPIGVTDVDEMNDRKPNTSIDQIVENAGNRVSVELTDQLWDLLRGLSLSIRNWIHSEY